MKIIRKRFKSFNDLDLPPIVYKYREWKNKVHKTILTKNEIYFSAPSDFKDQYDCKVPIRYDLLTDDEIYEKYYHDSKQQNPYFSRQEHRKFARDWQKKGLMKNKKRNTALDEEFYQKFNSIFGVFSVTAKRDNNKMWECYSDNHKGFCVGFRSAKMFKNFDVFGSGGKICYYNELPIIKETDDFDTKIYLQIYSKLKKWKYEKEYRLTKFNIINRKVIIPYDICAEIIFGAKMKEVDKEEIIKIVQQKLPEVKFLQAKLTNNKIKVEKYRSNKIC